MIRLREGFRRKGQNSSSGSSEGCGSSVKRSSSSVETGQHGQAMEAISKTNSHCLVDVNNWNNMLPGQTNSCREGVNSDKSMDSGRPSLAIRSSSCRSVSQEVEMSNTFLEKYFEPHSSLGTLLGCPISGSECPGGESSSLGTTSAANQQLTDSSLALVLRESLNDPKFAMMLRRKARQGNHELASLLQDKGLDPNFAVMLKENGLDPTILALLQRGSLDADRDHVDAIDATPVESDRLESVIPNHISFSDELRQQGFEKWIDLSKLFLHYIVGTPERAWILFSLVFIIDTVIVAVFRPKTIKLINATHEQVIYIIYRHP